MRVDPLAGASAHRDVRSRAAGMRFPASPARGSTRVAIPVGTTSIAGSRATIGTTANAGSRATVGTTTKRGLAARAARWSSAQARRIIAGN